MNGIYPAPAPYREGEPPNRQTRRLMEQNQARAARSLRRSRRRLTRSLQSYGGAA